MVAGAASARSRLLDAASRLFYEEGMTATGIDTITAAAGVAKQSLYNNFASKDDLMLAYIEARHEEWLGLYRERLVAATTPRERVRAVGDASLDHARFEYARGFRGCGSRSASARASMPPGPIASPSPSPSSSRARCAAPGSRAARPASSTPAPSRSTSSTPCERRFEPRGERHLRPRRRHWVCAATRACLGGIRAGSGGRPVSGIAGGPGGETGGRASRRARLGGIGLIALASLLWGTTGTSATFAPEAGPLAIGAAALGIGGLLQAAIAVPALRAAWPALRIRLPLVLLGAVAVAVYPLAFYSSMRLAGVAVGSVVSLASAPLASGVLERIVDRLPLSRWWMLAAGLGVVGCILLSASKLEAGAVGDAAAGAAVPLGILLGLVAGATYAVYSWVARRLIDDGIGRAASMGAVFGAGGLLLMPVLLVTGAPLVATPQAFAVAAYMALVPMFLGYLLFGFGLTRVSASTATTVTLTEPAVAAVLAVLVVGEQLSAVGWAGLGVIALVLVLLSVAPTNHRASTRRGIPADPAFD